MSGTSSYDEVLYPNYVHAQTHPDRLATIATLFGMKPASVAESRVLELGCGRGGNLIPLAVSYPNSSFLGVDLSERQIAEGKGLIAALELKNIELRAVSVLDFALSEGKFDFIICHGVFSWVPEAVRNKLMQIARDHLAPQGVAFISYNTYPGWHQRRMIRDMMLYHSRSFEEPKKQIEQAKAFLTFMTKAIPEDTAYGRSLHEEYRSLCNVDESYIFHEQLEEVNEPIYFHEFAALAKEHGLQYVSEVELSNLLLDRYPPQVAKVLAGLEVVEREQYLDFLTRRTFRQTLLCHSEVGLDRNEIASRVERLRVSSAALTGQTFDLSSLGKPMVLNGMNGSKLTISDPMVQMSLRLLAMEWPNSISFAELLIAVRAELSSGKLVVQSQQQFERDLRLMSHSLAHCFVMGVAQFHLAPPTFNVSISERPTACPLARHQAISNSCVTSRQHSQVHLDPISSFLLSRLDGTADRQGLLADLLKYVQDNSIRLQKDGQVIVDESERSAALVKHIDESLTMIRNQGLLIS